jgi:type I restriction enzyme R subunit
MPVASVASMPLDADEPPGDALPRAHGVLAAQEGGMNSVESFEFLRPRWPALASVAGFAERYVHLEPESRLTKLRILLEQVVEHVYSHHRLPKPWQSQLYHLLGHHPFKEVVPPLIIQTMHAIRMAGNKGAHGGEPDRGALSGRAPPRPSTSPAGSAVTCTRRSRRPRCRPSPTSKPGALEESKAELKREKKDGRSSEQPPPRRDSRNCSEENERLRKAEHEARSAGPELDAALAQTSAAIRPPSSTPWASTRPPPAAASSTSCCATPAGTSPTPRACGSRSPSPISPRPPARGFADYVLLGDDGVPLAVVEAKKASVGAGTPAASRPGATPTASNAAHGRRPVIYYANGYGLRCGTTPTASPPRKVYGYHSKESLVYMTRPAAARMPARQIVPGQAHRQPRLSAARRSSG